MKSITPVHVTKKAVRDNSGETVNVKGLPPISKTFDTHSVSQKTDTNTIQNAAEKQEIKILNKKISQLELELSKVQKTNNSAVF